MIAIINALVLAVSSSLAASIVAKATVTTALALIGVRLARRNRAAMRHALLAVAFGVLIVLPIATIVAPPVRITLAAAARQRIVPVSARVIPSAAQARRSAGVPSVAPRPAAFSPSVLLLVAWIAGMALFLSPVAIGLWQVRGLRRSAVPWRNGQSVADKLAFDAGIHRRVEVLLHAAVPGPMTCGVVHPAIVLPQDAQTWEAADLDRALVHELEHVRRVDWVTRCIARAMCAVYWFHPLVWIAWRRLALEAERSCDDAVLERSEATAYADQLVGLAQRLSAAKSPLLAMVNRTDLATRVGAVLDGGQQRGRAGTLPVALACAVAAALVLTVSPLSVVAAPQLAGTQVQAPPMPQFSANGMLVMVSVVVSDKDGKSIEGLSANDFAVTEDGVPQTIGVFEFQKTEGSPSSYYLVGYYTTNQNADGKFRTIKIVGKQDAMAKLDYRAGYNSGLRSSGVDHTAGLDTTSPLLIYKKDPEYSEAARKAKYQGTAVLGIEVDTSGLVANIKVIRSLGLGLDQKAIEAVQQWKFRPGIKDGRAVAVQAQVAVNFRLL